MAMCKLCVNPLINLCVLECPVQFTAVSRHLLSPALVRCRQLVSVACWLTQEIDCLPLGELSAFFNPIITH